MTTDVGAFGSSAPEVGRAGLCEICRHVKKLSNDRGSVFYMCGLAETDARFSRYPRLPVLQCAGYKPATSENPSGQKEDPKSR